MEHQHLTAAVNFKAPPRLVEGLRELAAREANPMSAIARRLLTAGLEQERRTGSVKPGGPATTHR